MPMMKPTMEGDEPRPMAGGEDEGGLEQPGQDGAGAAPGAPKDNPVIDALKVLQMFIAGQKQKGNPQAAAMIQAFQAFLQSMGAGGKGTGPEQPPAEAPPVEGVPDEGPMPMGKPDNSVPIV